MNGISRHGCLANAPVSAGHSPCPHGLCVWRITRHHLRTHRWLRLMESATPEDIWAAIQRPAWAEKQHRQGFNLVSLHPFMRPWRPWELRTTHVPWYGRESGVKRQFEFIIYGSEILAHTAWESVPRKSHYFPPLVINIFTFCMLPCAPFVL